MTSDQEVPIRGKKVFFLKKVLDVTSEAESVLEEAQSKGQVIGSRKLAYLMEKKYSGQTGLQAWFSSMWSGSRYYIALYEVYSDVRLVAAPPVSVAAFGGDIDNWEWPQHKCDFALYRIYTAPDGVLQSIPDLMCLWCRRESLKSHWTGTGRVISPW
jgi:hypothetical protein